MLVTSSDNNCELLRLKLQRVLHTTMHRIGLWTQAVHELGFVRNAAEPSDTILDTMPTPSFESVMSYRKIAYYNVPTAALSGLYDSASIIALSLLPLVTGDEKTYEEDIWRHSDSILSASEFIKSSNCPDSMRGSLMLLFPLKVAQLWSRSLHQVNLASEAIMAMDHKDQFDTDSPITFFGDVATHLRHRTNNN